MKTTIYTIEQDYLQLMQEIENAEGEITPEIEEALAINETQLESKSIAYNKVIQTKKALNTQIDEEIKRLQALKKRNSNLISRLEETLLNAVKIFGTIETAFNKFGTRKSSRIEVENVNDLPKEFKVIKVTEQADKKALKEAIKNGAEIPGVTLVECENLKIS
jgi:hypothetical protein